ncbi:flavodoxin domain-containing protein [Psychromonas aquimarina]|uniref:flavodoxin domain-containing protein n=1 Tax=Psychromonas aquimarina TaxID=444919 RepID=UPI0003F6C952|nr:flavodoxin domain-containing protein [Psychromonas aquimarina]
MKTNLSVHFNKIWKLFAWCTLILAFVVGNIASKADYLTLVKAQYPDYNWSRSEAYPDLPVVFTDAADSTDQALLIAVGKGFGGPFILAVKVHKEAQTARIKEVTVLSHKETPPYLQKLIKQNFFRQFINKQVGSDYILRDDIDAVSGATISSKGFTKAIRETVHQGAQNHLGYQKTWQSAKWAPGINEALMTVLFGIVLVVVYAPKKIARPFKFLLPFASLAFVGFYMNASISLGTLAGIVMGYVPEFRQHPIWWILVAGVLSAILLLGRNLYCGYLCPFSVVQNLLQKISGIKLALHPAMVRNAQRVVYGLSWFALILIFLSRHPALGSYEPFSMMFSLQGMGLQWYILPISLFGSFLIPQFWCRLFCPVGLYLTEAVRLRQAAVNRVSNIFVKELSCPSSAAESSSKRAAAVTIVFATQTGNSRDLAYQLKAACDSGGLAARVKSMADFQLAQLKPQSRLIIVTSTYGEGEPPQDAVSFHQQLFADDAPRLNHVHYAVLALGDSSYRFFCRTGIEFDRRLSDLGALCFIERADCDRDYQEQAGKWIKAAVQILQSRSAGGAFDTVKAPVLNAPKQINSCDKPVFSARLLSRNRISDKGCAKGFYHIVLAAPDSGIQYQPGDLLSVTFENCAEQVDALLHNLSISPCSEIKAGITIRQALITSFELTLCRPGFIEKYALLSQHQELLDLLADREHVRNYAARHQIFEIVRRYPAAVSAQEFLLCLRRVTPRKYSIASSSSAIGDEVHLTVSLVNYQADGFDYCGGASGFLSRRASIGTEIQVFIQENKHFHLPKCTDTAVIMIGAGCGIAPFRAFMQERDVQKHQGRNWLFLGNQNQELDYLYKNEWQGYLERGVLNALDLAFSRDQENKIYVQQRILEQADQFYNWLEQGAHIYICGDRSNMAVGVEDAIVRVIELQGSMSRGRALSYLASMKQEKRFLTDIY